MNILVLAKESREKHTNKLLEKHLHFWSENGHAIKYFSTEDEKETPKIEKNAFDLNTTLTLLVNVFLRRKSYDLIVEKFDTFPFFIPVFTKSKKLVWLYSVPEIVNCKGTFGVGKMFCLAAYSAVNFIVFKTLYRNAEYVIDTKFKAEKLERLGIEKSKIHVLPRGVENKKSLKEKSINILALSNSLDKHASELATLFSLIERKKAGSEYWLISDSKKIKTRLVREAKRLDMKNVNVVAEKDMDRVLQKADAVYVHKSYKKGFAAVKAAASGCVVFLFDNKYTNEYVKKNKAFVILKDDNPILVSEAILQVLASEKKLNKLRKLSISWAEKFNWKKIKDKGLNLIESI